MSDLSQAPLSASPSGAPLSEPCTAFRLKPSARRVLNALRTGPKTTAQLCQPDIGGVRFGARVAELRALRYVIAEQRVRQGSSLYELHFDAERGSPGPERPVPRPAPATAEQPLSLGVEGGLFDGDRNPGGMYDIAA